MALGTFSATVTMEAEGDVLSGPNSDQGHLTEFTAHLTFQGLRIGTMSGTLIKGDLILADRGELFQKLDEESSELADIARDIFDDEDTWYKPAFAHEMDQPNGLTILLLSRLTVDHGFRGHKLGLALMQYVLREIPHDVAVMKPFPLQHETSPSPEHNFELYKPIPVGRATAKLRKHYGSLGFKRIARTPLMARSAADAEEFVWFRVTAKAVEALRETAKQVAQEYLDPPEPVKTTRRYDDVDRAILAAAHVAINASDWTTVGTLVTLLQDRVRR